MKQITTKLPEHVVESLDHVAAEQYSNNRSEAIRELIVQALDDGSDEQEQKLRERIEALERENERLRNEKRMILEQREEHTQLVRSIQRDQTLSERKSRANILTRWKWKLTGMPDDE